MHRPRHPLETPAAEGFFKTLLWIMLLLLICLFVRQFNGVLNALHAHQRQAELIHPPVSSST